MTSPEACPELVEGTGEGAPADGYRIKIKTHPVFVFLTGGVSFHVFFNGVYSYTTEGKTLLLD
jgi:hypothetical protein